MMKSLKIGAVVAATWLVCSDAAMAAGPVQVLDAPSAVVHVKKGRNAAAAAGVAAGVLLGGLLAGAANANEPAYVQPEDYGYQPPPPQYGYQTYVRQNPNYSVELCRRGVFAAARRYGARDARVERVYGMKTFPSGGQKFRAVITVYYPQGPRTSTMVCATDHGYLTSARAE